MNTIKNPPHPNVTGCPSSHDPSNIGETDVSPGQIFSDNLPQVAQCIKAFQTAESYIKAAELNDGNLDHPAVNELRYYGYHFNKALNALNAKDQYEELKRAERHCGRAQYDAAELSLIHYLEIILVFKKDYKKVVITKIVPEYPTLMAETEEIQDFLAKNSNHERQSYFEQCIGHIETLKRTSRLLDNSRNDLNANKKISRREISLWAFSLITLLGLLYNTFFTPETSIKPSIPTMGPVIAETLIKK